jgi:long-chain acyl-CoA synthetase
MLNRELPSESIYESFEEKANQFGHKQALIYLGTEFTYYELRDLSERFAGGLYELGVREGDKVIFYLPNIPQFIIAWLALQRIGALAIPVTPIFTPHDMKYISNDCSAETIICLDTNFGYVAEFLSETNLKRVIVTTIVELLPWWKRLIGKAFDRVPHGRFTLGKNIFPFRKLFQKTSSRLPPCRVGGKDTSFIIYTGGTTGTPKGVSINNILFLQCANEIRKVLDPVVPRGEGIVIQGGPLFHILGMQMGIGAPLCLVGDTVILLPRVNLDGVFDYIERYRANILFGVPTFYRMILEHDRVDYYDLSSLKYCLSGGDTLPVAVGKRWFKKFGVPIYDGYGVTETCGGVAMTIAGEKSPEGSVGKILPHHKGILVEPDTLKPVPYGEPGELLVSSEHMVTAYWNKPEETAKCFVTTEGILWYRTRDIMRMDENGWLFYLDRSVDTIKHKGYRVAAAEIEAILQEHPAVIASCVVGVPDEKVGERIKAFVVLKEDVRGVDGYELIRWCRERLAPYKVPHYIEFRDMLPKSKTGKLLRRELRAEQLRNL